MTTQALAADYQQRVDDLLEQYRAIPSGAPVRLAKATSNLFRPRQSATAGLDVSGFSGVLRIDEQARTAEVLGMTTYEDLVAATLPHGLVPLCVPELRTITLGGAVTGLGIESPSFRNGCPHESVLEMDILTGSGEVVTATATNEHAELFHAFPNSYGSLGYALRLVIELEPVQPYVHLRHIQVGSATEAAALIAEVAGPRGGVPEFDGERVDYLDGTVFADDRIVLTLGSYAAELPVGRRASDYTGDGIYYRSIEAAGPAGGDDYLTIADYIWRWDTDWFWCSRAFGVQRPGVRRLWPDRWKRSDVYWKLVALDRRYQLSDRLHRARGLPRREQVVQDIEVPLDRLAEFLDFFHREVGIEPVWLCPLRQRDPEAVWTSYELDPDVMYVNVGFWSTVPLPDGTDPNEGVVNRAIEAEVTRLGGRKSLYSTAFYEREEFDRLYGGAVRGRLRRQYDPSGRLADLFEKVVTAP